MVAFNAVAFVARKDIYVRYGSKFAFARQIITNALYDIWALVCLVGLRCYRGSWTGTNDAVALKRRTWLLLVAAAFCDGLADFLSSVSGSNGACLLP